MRVNRFAFAMTATLAFAWAGAASAGGVLGGPSDLLEGTFFYAADPNDTAPNFCQVDVDFDQFNVNGEVRGLNGAQVVRVLYTTTQPTSVSRSSNKASIKQSSWSQLTFFFDAVQVGPVIIDKCKVSGSVNDKKTNQPGSVSADCKGDDVFGVLSVGQADAVEAAFASTKFVKVNVNANKGKASITIKCKGDNLD